MYYNLLQAHNYLSLRAYLQLEHLYTVSHFNKYLITNFITIIYINEFFF